MNFVFGFAVGVVVGPTFTHKVWPLIVAAWKKRQAAKAA